MKGLSCNLSFGLPCLAAVGVACSVSGWWVTSNHYQACISAMQRDQALTQERTQADALQRVLNANERADFLTSRLQRQGAQLDQLTKDKTDAIRRLTTGRACLSADAVRVLNSTTPGAADVPTPAAGAAATGADVASDSDVAAWISTAQQQHEQCRQRLDALIDFNSPAVQP